MKKVGVTGAAGFIGSHLCERLLAEGYEVVGVDDLSFGSIENVAPFLDNPKFRFEKLDCTRVDRASARFRRLRRDHAPRGEEDPALRRRRLDARSERRGCACCRHGGTGPRRGPDPDVDVRRLRQRARRRSARTGTSSSGPRRRSAGRMRCRSSTTSTSGLALAEEQGLKVTILRLFNVYGPRNHLSWWGGPMVTFAEAVLDGEPMEIHGDGLQTRTFTYVSDTVDAFVRALQTPESRGEIVNVGATATISMIELAERIQTMLGVPDATTRHVRAVRDAPRQVPGRQAPGPRHHESEGASRLRSAGQPR